MMGINVATDGDLIYSDLIVTGQKMYETRDSNSLAPYVGQRVGIIETKRGSKARLVGFVDVGAPMVVGSVGFDALSRCHLVPEFSKYDIKKGQQKWLYPMINPEKLTESIDASETRGIVARNITGLLEADKYRQDMLTWMEENTND